MRQDQRISSLKKEQLSIILQTVPAMLAYVDRDLNYVFVNPAYANWIGKTPEELEGKKISEITGPNTYKELLPYISATLAGEIVKLEKEIHFTTAKKHMSTIYTPDKDEAGFVRGYTVLINDTTEQKKIQDSLNENQHIYQQLLNQLSAAIYVTDSEGRITLFNPAAAKLWGREPVIGKDLWCGSWKIFSNSGKPLELDTCPMAIAIKEGRPVIGEEIVVERPDGSRINVLPHPRPILNGEGKIIGAINMLVDVTGLKQAHYALNESEERFRALANQAPVAIWMSDVSSNFSYLNPKWSEITGVPHTKGLGIGWLDFVHPKDREKVFSNWQEAFRSGQVYDDKFRYRNANGEYSIVQVNGNVRINEIGDFMGYTGIFNDITLIETTKTILENQVEERTKDLIRANNEFERSNQELEQFAYAASHDLQEPLRKILTFSERILQHDKDNLSDAALDYFNRMSVAASRMQHLIVDLLSFSKIKTSNKRDFEAVSLNRLLEEAKFALNFSIEESGAIIECAELPVVSVIPFQFRQVFQNVLSNSIKYKKQDVAPRIKISCEHVNNLQKLPSNGFFLKISISDNGIGFDQQFEHKIFEIFQRLHGKTEYSGTGVGLAICKKIVQNHGGHIEGIGQTGVGATFNIYIPVTR
jgi:PAS domain S-box-containing protein